MNSHAQGGLSLLDLPLSDGLFSNMEPLDIDFGLADESMSQLKFEEESLIDSGISTPIESLSPGPASLLDASVFDSIEWDMLTSPKADALIGFDSPLTDMCGQLDLEATGNFIGLQLDFDHLLAFNDANSATHVELSADMGGAINPQALQSSTEDDEEEIDVVGLESDEAREKRQSMEQQQPQSITIAQPVIFATDSTSQLTIPTVIPGMTSIVLPSYSPFSTTSTDATPASSRSTSPTNIKSARMQPYPTPPHTPKRNTERKRQLHNELERKRREDLNSVFNQLGEVIPSLTVGSKGAPTQTQILQGATHLLRTLKVDKSHLAAQRESLLLEQSKLQARLSQLKVDA
jgi:hypothetical protein